MDTEIGTSEVEIDSPSLDGPVFSSRPKYTSSVASDQTCDVILPVKFNMVGSQLVVNDHPLGDNAGSTSGSDVTLDGKFINKVCISDSLEQVCKMEFLATRKLPHIRTVTGKTHKEKTPP